MCYPSPRTELCVCVCVGASARGSLTVVPGSKVAGSAVTVDPVTGSALSDNNGCAIQARLATRSDRVAAEEWQPTRRVGVASGGKRGCGGAP